MRLLREYISGRRVSNTWVTYPQDWDNGWKQALIPDRLVWLEYETSKVSTLGAGPAAHQLVGRVTAYQGNDG